MRLICTASSKHYSRQVTPKNLMNVRNTMVLLLQRLLNPLDVRIVKLNPNKVRGIDPFSDLAFLLQHKPDPIIFDVGANDGETVQEFIARFPSARVFAFEPYAACCEILDRKFRGNANIQIQNVALGEDRGTSELNLYSGDRMNSLLRLDDAPGNVMSKSFTRAGSVEVKLEALDAFCADSGIDRIDVLKIDTQGYDLQVLGGARRLLEEKRIKTILLEVNFVPMYERQATFSQLHEFLSTHGYRFVDFYNQVRPDNYTAWCDACYVAAEPV